MPDDITPVSPPAPAGNWFDAFEPEIKGHMQNRGLDKLDPASAALEAMKAHRAAEKRLGAPADELVRFPKDPNDASWTEIFKRLGKPEAPTGYDLSPLAPADKPLAPELVSVLQAAAHKANMAPGQALAFADAFLKHQALEAGKAASEANFNKAANVEKLKANWGANFDFNLHIAQRAAEKMGLTPEKVTALENATDYATVMETLRGFGAAMGEARVIQGEGPGQNGPMSADQAQEWLDSLKTDKALFQKWYDGDADTRRRFTEAHRIILQSKQPR